MTKPSPPPTWRAVSTALRERLGGTSGVRTSYDAGEQNVAAVIEVEGSPRPELATYVTASLHAVENRLGEDDIRVELMRVGPQEVLELGNVVATSAFNVAKDGWLAAPGVVFPGVVVEYLPSVTATHLLWVEPIDHDGLSTLAVDGVAHDVHPLQGVPITDAEWELLRRGGLLRAGASAGGGWRRALGPVPAVRRPGRGVMSSGSLRPVLAGWNRKRAARVPGA